RAARDALGWPHNAANKQVLCGSPAGKRLAIGSSPQLRSQALRCTGGCAPMAAIDSEVLFGRHYFERGYIDAVMFLFVMNAVMLGTADGSRIADRLLDRNRIPDVVRVCEPGAVPLPRERMLQSGDLAIRRRDVDGAMRIYELAGADRDRWSRLVDVM